MTKFGPAILCALAACGGKEEEACTDLLVVVTVTNPEGLPVEDATVSLDDIACTDTGDGMEFECVAPEAGDYTIYALGTSYEPFGQLFTIEDPVDCEGAAFTQAVTLQRESAV